MHIPMGCSGNKDTRRWYFSKSGHYSVRSAYYAVREPRKQNQTAMSPTSSISHEKNWSFVWGIDTPNKIKDFLWCLLRKGLPVALNLIRRNIQLDPVCVLCKDADESIAHVFHSCPFARLVWALSEFPTVVFI